MAISYAKIAKQGHERDTIENSIMKAKQEQEELDRQNKEHGMVMLGKGNPYVNSLTSAEKRMLEIARDGHDAFLQMKMYNFALHVLECSTYKHFDDLPETFCIPEGLGPVNYIKKFFQNNGIFGYDKSHDFCVDDLSGRL